MCVRKTAFTMNFAVINRSNNFTNNFSNGFGGAIRLGSPDGGKSTTHDICKLK